MFDHFAFFSGYENSINDWEGQSQFLNLENLEVGQTVSMNIYMTALSLRFISVIKSYDTCIIGHL